MSIIGSIQALQQGKTTGFIGYPRSYEVGSTPSSSIIRGVDQAGVPFMLELSIPDRFIAEAKLKPDVSVPDVASLAETHRRARNPCYAASDNGPGSVTGGVFLAEQVQAVDAARGHYKANWLSILRDVDDAPMPRTGIGYLEINGKQPHTSEYESEKLRLIGMNEAYDRAMIQNPQAETIMDMHVLDFTAARDKLALSLYEMQKKWYIGVELQYHRLEQMKTANELHGKSQVLDFISSNTVNGMYGGVILRPISRDGKNEVVVVDSVRRLNLQYDYQKKMIPTVDTLWTGFIEKGGSGWLKAMKAKGYDVEIIPIQRVNCGGISNEKYSKEFTKGFPKQLKAFVDKRFYHAPYVNFGLQNAYLACPIGMRTAETRKSEFSGTVLLSTIHAFGKAIGNALELDRKGERTMKLSSLPAPIARNSTSRSSESNISYGG